MYSKEWEGFLVGLHALVFIKLQINNLSHPGPSSHHTRKHVTASNIYIHCWGLLLVQHGCYFPLSGWLHCNGRCVIPLYAVCKALWPPSG